MRRDRSGRARDLPLAGALKSLRERLREQLSTEDTDRLMQMRLDAAARELFYLNACKARGITPYHGVDQKATAKRRARNKAARQARRAQRASR